MKGTMRRRNKRRGRSEIMERVKEKKIKENMRSKKIGSVQKTWDEKEMRDEIRERRDEERWKEGGVEGWMEGPPSQTKALVRLGICCTTPPLSPSPSSSVNRLFSLWGDKRQRGPTSFIFEHTSV